MKVGEKMGYSEKVFELLGIKPDEEFKITSPFLEKDEKNYLYKLKNNMVVKYKDGYGRWNHDWTILPKILNGEMTIKKVIIPTDNEQIAINYARLLGHNWLAKDKDGTVFAYTEKPHKDKGGWSRDDYDASHIEYNISFISYDDDEPYYIGY